MNITFTKNSQHRNNGYTNSVLVDLPIKATPHNGFDDYITWADFVDVGEISEFGLIPDNKSANNRFIDLVRLIHDNFVWLKNYVDGRELVYYTITFDTDGGTNAPSKMSVPEGTPITLPSYNGTRPSDTIYSYTFAEKWILTSSNREYTTGESYTVNSNVTFKAKWNRTPINNYCIVTWNSMGGSVVSSQTVIKGTEIGTLPSTTLNGYGNLGWYRNSDCTNGPIDEHEIINSNVTFYALWPADTTYRVTINITNGSTIENRTKTVTANGNVMWTIKPDTEYDMPTSVYNAQVNGYNVTVSNVTSDMSITVNCVKKLHYYVGTSTINSLEQARMVNSYVSEDSYVVTGTEKSHIIVLVENGYNITFFENGLVSSTEEQILYNKLTPQSGTYGTHCQITQLTPNTTKIPGHTIFETAVGVVPNGKIKIQISNNS